MRGKYLHEAHDHAQRSNYYAILDTNETNEPNSDAQDVHFTTRTETRLYDPASSCEGVLILG